LRIGGTSKGADDMVTAGKEKGKLIFFDKDEVPLVR